MKGRTGRGTGSRYDVGGSNRLSFDEGVDSYVTYACSLHDNVEISHL